jgi:hypothetical protein
MAEYLTVLWQQQVRNCIGAFVVNSGVIQGLYSLEVRTISLYNELISYFADSVYETIGELQT